jgi:hypothetical protein
MAAEIGRSSVFPFMPSPEVFYLHIQGEQRGPYTIPQVDHLLNSGLIAEETLYWREGLDQWQPVTTLVKLRRKKNPWGKRFLILGIVAIVAVVLQFFLSIAWVGWREKNQHEYTKAGAYWRARDTVRYGGVLPEGAIVQFHGLSKAQVELEPPQSAVVILHGEVTLHSGEMHTVTWNVPMKFDLQNGEWTGGSARETQP